MRVFTWIILVVNVLVLIAAIAYVSSSHSSNNGSGFLVLAILQFWAAMDLILGTAWLLTRKRKAGGCRTNAAAA